MTPRMVVLACVALSSAMIGGACGGNGDGSPGVPQAGSAGSQGGTDAGSPDAHNGAAGSDVGVGGSAGGAAVRDAGAGMDADGGSQPETGGPGGAATGGAAGSDAGGGGGSDAAGSEAGGSAGSDGGAGGHPGCAAVTSLDDFQVMFSSTIRALISSPQLGSSYPDYVGIEFFSSSPKTGKTDLSTQADFAFCEECVYIQLDQNGPSMGKFLFASSGTLTLTKIDDPVSGAYIGSLSNVMFKEYEPVSGEFIDGGVCVTLAEAIINTDTPAGADCAIQEDCGNMQAQVCDPRTRKCVAAPCDPSASPTGCSGTDLCRYETGDLSVTTGACFPSCTPFVANSGCSTDSDCRATPLGVIGACYYIGEGTPDSVCNLDSTQIGTGCAAGYFCAQEAGGSYCRQTCNYFGAANCAGSQHCILNNVCTPTGEPNAAVGSICAATTSNVFCAASEGKLTGYCAEEDGGPTRVCRPVCRIGEPADCPTGECTTLFANNHEVGVCK